MDWYYLGWIIGIGWLLLVLAPFLFIAYLGLSVLVNSILNIFGGD